MAAKQLLDIVVKERDERAGSKISAWRKMNE